MHSSGFSNKRIVLCILKECSQTILDVIWSPGDATPPDDIILALKILVKIFSYNPSVAKTVNQSYFSHFPALFGRPLTTFQYGTIVFALLV